MSVRSTNIKPGLLRDTKGSTLTWVMVASIVVTLVIISVLAIISYNSHTTAQNRMETQAFYTAQSVNERIVNWISGAPAPDEFDPDASNAAEVLEPYNFIMELRTTWDTPVVQNYTEAELGENMGTATTTVEFTSDEFDELKITTTAEYAGIKETLSTKMYLQKVSDFTSINTGFDYTDVAIEDILNEIEMVPTWAENSDTVAETVSGDAWTYFDAASAPEKTVEGITARYSKMNPLFYNQYAVGKRDYVMRYLTAHAAVPDIKVYFDYTQGPNNGTEFIDPSEFPLTGGSLVMVAYGGSTQHGKITYYTMDDPNNKLVEDITVNNYLGAGTTPQVQVLNEFRFYATDTSDKLLKIVGGVQIQGQNGAAIYTRRNAEIGGATVDSHASTNYSEAFNRSNKLIFNKCNFIFADPGEDQEQRHSIIQRSGTGSDSNTEIGGGSILVQNNHELTIADGVSIVANENKGIVVETGGSLVIEGSPQITGNIYVARGATLTINGPAYITGNVYCSGTLNINSSFLLMTLDSNADNQELGYVSNNPEHGNCTGIFIYNDTKVGVGTLNVADNCIIDSPTYPSSNMIHTFVPYPKSKYPPQLFCDHVTDPSSPNNICGGWETNTYAWEVEPGSTQQER